MAKAAVKKGIANSIPSEEARAHGLAGSPNYQLIAAGDLYKSHTNPRKRFPEASIEELAGSIREHGVIEPLVVRPRTINALDHDTYEIVCGERRYRAAMRAADAAGSKPDEAPLPCLVRDLTDAEVLDIQIHENLHREDVHPIDEATGYKFLQDTFGFDTRELSTRVGKSEGYVLNRLKLNALIQEIQDDIDAGIVPMTYALEIAKFDPGTQKQIYDACFDTRWDGKQHVPDKTELKTFNHLQAYISQKVLYQLSRAPFDRKAANLRDDGLACAECPDRTGVNISLFDPKLIGKKDCCLNPTCYNAKSWRHVETTRAVIASDAGIDVEQVPLLISQYWGTDGKLGTGEYVMVKDTEAGKPGIIRAVSVAGETYGKVCCIRLKQTHSTETSSSERPKGQEKSPAEKRAFYARKEELFDVNVGEIVRKRVLRIAAEGFATRFTLDGGGTNFLPSLLAKIWATSNNGDDVKTRQVIAASILADVMDVDEGKLDLGHYDQGEVTGRIARQLSDKNQKLLLFLLVHGNKGAMYFPNYKSQQPVRELAEEYDIDYQLIDAKVRLEVSSKKMKKAFQDYLTAVETDKRVTPVPRSYLEDYKPQA